MTPLQNLCVNITKAHKDETRKKEKDVALERLRDLWRALDIDDPRAFYVGVDPGTQGAIAALDQSGKMILAVGFKGLECDTSAMLCHNIANGLGAKGAPVYCAIEWVNSRPGEGHKGAFTFGESFGSQRTALMLSKAVDCKVTTSAKWQREIGAVCKGDKQILIERARAHWPDWKYTKGGMTSIADAALIALWLHGNAAPFIGDGYPF